MLKQESGPKKCWSSSETRVEKHRFDNWDYTDGLPILRKWQDEGAQTDMDGGEKDKEGCSAAAARTTRCSRRHSTLLSGKSSHRRRTSQDMTRSLKMWLYENRDNPYPTKKEKVTLAAVSEMTLVQVSNWFANARRRLKNIVRQPGLTWSRRIKLYNRHAADTAERLSVASLVSEELDVPPKDESPVCPHFHDTSPAVEFPGSNIHVSAIAPSTVADEDVSYPDFRLPVPVWSPKAASLHTFKQSILHRYLNDSIQHQAMREFQPPTHLLVNDGTPPSVMVNESGSLSSHEYEDVSCSLDSTESGGNHTAFHDECTLYPRDEYRPIHFQLQTRSTIQGGGIICQTSEAEETYWKEITAALVLTNMARAKRQQRLL